MASHLPGFAMTPAVAVGMGAAVVAVLRLPLSAVVLAVLLTAGIGRGRRPAHHRRRGRRLPHDPGAVRPWLLRGRQFTGAGGSAP